MLRAWFKGARDKEERRKVIFQSSETLDVLKNVLEEWKEEEMAGMLSRTSEGEDWAYKQAEHVAAIRTYNKIIALLILDRGD